MWLKKVRYERTRYLDPTTGEVVIGEGSFKRMLRERGWNVRFVAEEKKSEEVGDTRYITTTRHFRVEGVNNKLNF